MARHRGFGGKALCLLETLHLGLHLLVVEISIVIQIKHGIGSVKIPEFLKTDLIRIA